jgi:hypothetical protein
VIRILRGALDFCHVERWPQFALPTCCLDF